MQLNSSYATRRSLTETQRQLKELGRRCDPCQRIQAGPTRFKESFRAEHVKFNDSFMMDILHLDGKLPPHIMDEDTDFSAAMFLVDISTTTIWEIVVECWASTYTGLP